MPSFSVSCFLLCSCSVDIPKRSFFFLNFFFLFYFVGEGRTQRRSRLEMGVMGGLGDVEGEEPTVRM